MHPIFSFEESELIKREPEWELSDYDKMKLSLKLQQSPSFMLCSESHGRNITSQIRKHIQNKTKLKDNNMIITITGETGSGKSRVAQQIAKWIKGTLYKDFIKNVTFSNEEFLQRCAEVPKGDVVIKDEQTQTFGIGSEREAQEMENIEMVVRRFGLNIIFCSPYSKFEHRTKHLVLETICVNRVKRKSKLAVKFGNAYLGYIIVHIPEDSKDVVWQEYEKENEGDKDKFIEAVKNRQVLRIDYKQLAEKSMKHPAYHSKLKMADVQFIIRDQNPNLTSQEITNIARAFFLYFR